MDEATPHLHLDYIPVAHGYKTKMHTRNSLTKALQEMGIESAVSKNDTETMHWQQREREYLIEMCRERGLEVEIIVEKRDNYTIPEYKAARQTADELTAELEILNAEKKEAESIIADVNVQVSESVELVAESKHQLEEINSQIVDKEKEYAAYEKKIDTLLAAERPVKRELALIRQDIKQLPTILGGEPYFKISEKNLNKLMEMAQGAGTLKNLTMAYEKEISAMKKTIDRLSAQVKTFKSKVKQHEAFLDLRGWWMLLWNIFVLRQFRNSWLRRKRLWRRKREDECRRWM